MKSDRDLPVPTSITVLDAHVHIHDCFDPSAFFDNAYENFLLHATPGMRSTDVHGVLLLTESHGVEHYAALRRSAESGDPAQGRWRAFRNDEIESLTVAKDDDSARLSIIAGRQIVTSEKLEILALGFPQSHADGEPIRKVIRNVQSAGAICVLPWGFGKWTGRRGRIVRELLEDNLGENFFLGDNAGRLGLWPAPTEFKMAAAKQIRLLPGSDPLPYARGVSSVGRFGLTIDRPIDWRKPFHDLRQLLLDRQVDLRSFGTLEHIVPFVRNQLAMQLRKFI
jgi:hypothetical protein